MQIHTEQTFEPVHITDISLDSDSTDLRDKIILHLNEMLYKDPNAMTNVLRHRVGCHKSMGELEHVFISKAIPADDKAQSLSPIGLINSVLSVIGIEPIVAQGIGTEDMSGMLLINKFAKFEDAQAYMPVTENSEWDLYCPKCGYESPLVVAQEPICPTCDTPFHIRHIGTTP